MSIGLIFGYIELVFWTFFAFYVLKEPYSIDFLPNYVQAALHKQSDFFYILTILMIFTGFLWVYGVHKKKRSFMYANEVLTWLLNLALFIILVVAPVLMVIQKVNRWDRQRVGDGFWENTEKAFFYFDEGITKMQVENGEIFGILFKKALPSLIYAIFSVFKNSVNNSVRMKVERKSKSNETQMNYII